LRTDSRLMGDADRCNGDWQRVDGENYWIRVCCCMKKSME
jgi:hypothetical protein